jgi:hypothetical protein
VATASELPYTGLPLWILFVAGGTLLVLGVLVIALAKAASMTPEDDDLDPGVWS